MSKDHELNNPWAAEQVTRYADALDEPLVTGIAYLDDAFGGIMPRELVIVGAATGVGKTELSCQIARANAENQKQVCLIALEAEPYEIIRRIKYTEVSRYFYNNRSEFKNYHGRINFREWYLGKYPWLEPLDLAIAKELDLKLGFLNVYPNNQTLDYFNRRDFLSVYRRFAKEPSQLILLDHLHMFDALAEDFSEFSAVQKNTIELRKAINETGVPLIAMSHLRKKDRQAKWVVPPLEELHGSSEISKRANIVVTLAPAYYYKSFTDDEVKTDAGSTWIHIPKCRASKGPLYRYVALTKFDLSRGRYSSVYHPFTITPYDPEPKPVRREDFADWMTNAVEAPG